MENREEFIGKRIGKTSKRIRHELDALYDRYFSNEKITRQQARLLRYLRNHPEATASDVQRDFFLVKSSTSDLLNGLVKHRLIEYRRAEGDRRRKIIALTPAGLAYEERVSAVFAEFERALASSLLPEEEAMLVRLLEKIENNLGASLNDEE